MFGTNCQSVEERTSEHEEHKLENREGGETKTQAKPEGKNSRRNQQKRKWICSVVVLGTIKPSFRSGNFTRVSELTIANIEHEEASRPNANLLRGWWLRNERKRSSGGDNVRAGGRGGGKEEKLRRWGDVCPLEGKRLSKRYCAVQKLVRERWIGGSLA